MSLLAELKRRHVFRIAAAYVVGAWIAIQVAATIAPLLGMPDWVPRLVVLLSILGFPIAVALAWIYDLGERGLERTAPKTSLEPTAPEAPTTQPVSLARSASDPVTSLAVLPIDEAGSDDALADGLTEALITDLARTTQLKVISRSSVARFRRTTESPRSIAEALNVDALVTGTVRRSGDRIRISVELMDAKSERVLWADRFDRELEDVLRLQDDVARAIAREVGTYATSDAQAVATAALPRKVVPEVYLLDLRGRRMMESRTEAGFRAALGCFEQALDLDPSYGPSYLGVARAHNMLANYGLEAPRQAHSRVRSAIERALTMGADEAEAQGELAQMVWQFDLDWAGADRAYRQALEIAPRNARLWYWHGTMLAVGGRFDAALESLTRSEELDPLSPMIPANRGWIHYFARRYDQSIATLREVLALNPELAPAHWFLGMARVAKGDLDGAIESYGAAIARTGRISRLLGYLGHAYGRAQRRDEAQALLQELRERARGAYMPPYFLALVLAGLEDREGALDELEAAHAQGDTMLRDVFVDESFDTLRDEPRFQRLIARLHLPYDPSGSTAAG
jgi:TolB-like protein/tetratricopeptide (TPR) repeat protein